MNKTFLIIIILTLNLDLAYSQRVNKCLTNSRARHIKKIAIKRSCIDKKDSLNCLFFYVGEFKKQIDREQLTDKVVFENISLAFNNGRILNIFRSRSKKRPSYMALLYKKPDQIIATVSLNQFRCFTGGSIYYEYKALIDFFIKYKPRIIMVMNDTQWDSYFANVDGKLKVLHYIDDGYKVIGVEELEEQYWEDIFDSFMLEK